MVDKKKKVKPKPKAIKKPTAEATPKTTPKLPVKQPLQVGPGAVTETLRKVSPEITGAPGAKTTSPVAEETRPGGFKEWGAAKTGLMGLAGAVPGVAAFTQPMRKKHEERRQRQIKQDEQSLQLFFEIAEEDPKRATALAKTPTFADALTRQGIGPNEVPELIEAYGIGAGEATKVQATQLLNIGWTVTDDPEAEGRIETPFGGIVPPVEKPTVVPGAARLRGPKGKILLGTAEEEERKRVDTMLEKEFPGASPVERMMKYEAMTGKARYSASTRGNKIVFWDNFLGKVADTITAKSITETNVGVYPVRDIMGFQGLVFYNKELGQDETKFVSAEELGMDDPFGELPDAVKEILGIEDEEKEGSNKKKAKAVDQYKW